MMKMTKAISIFLNKKFESYCFLF